MKLGIGLPLTDSRVHTQFFLSFLLMQKYDAELLLPQHPDDIDTVRNGLVRQAQRDGITHLVMMDTDQIYPVDTLTKMLKHLEGLPVVGAQVHRRWVPFSPILYRGNLHEWKYVPDDEAYSGKLIKVDATGCGCIGYNMQVFDAIKPPWFEVYNDKVGRVGEDIGFCDKLQQADIPIHVDTSIEVGHIGTMLINRATYEIFKACMKNNGAISK